jgi:hypothetical protein
MTSATLPLVTSDVDTRWVGAGSSGAADARTAGRAATVEALTGGAAKLVIVFANDRYDLPALVDGVREVAGHDVHVVGCTTVGELHADRAGDLGVSVLALGGDGFEVATRVEPGTSGDPRGAGSRVAAVAGEVAPEGHRLLLLLVDGITSDGQEIVRGVYDTVGAEIPLVGGAAADDMKMQAAYQFHGAPGAAVDVHTDAVVAVALRRDGPVGIGVDHGWRHVGEPVLVTSGAANVVHTINDEPALDAYLGRLGAPADAWHDAAAFSRFSFTRPLGLVRRGSTVVRLVVAPDYDARSLICGAEVPQGRLVWFMEGDSDSVLDATDVACAQAVDALGGATPRGLLVFDCAARRAVLGDRLDAEASRIGVHASGAAMAGFYTMGEIARTRGSSGYHNKTLVVLALG